METSIGPRRSRQELKWAGFQGAADTCPPRCLATQHVSQGRGSLPLLAVSSASHPLLERLLRRQEQPAAALDLHIRHLLDLAHELLHLADGFAGTAVEGEQDVLRRSIGTQVYVSV